MTFTFRNSPAHLLAYGHSNQTTFRTPAIQDAYDAVVVPGTIATYYQQATGGFVLALNRPYFIDPRTPLFQQNLIGQEIRASFYTLSSAHGPTIENAVDEASGGDIELWDSIVDNYDPAEVAENWLDYQRYYVEESSEKLDHYAALVGHALDSPKQPSFFTNPYWMSEKPNSIEWSMTYDTIVEMHDRLENGERMMPIVAWKRAQPDSWRDLDRIICDVRDIGFEQLLVWIDSFRELEEPVGQLRSLRQTVARSASDGIQLGMLYGGYYSLALGRLGLWSFGNGVGYSESRAFPELPSTGAAPPRYYLYGLHRYVQPDVATQLLRNDIDDMFDILGSSSRTASGYDPMRLSYHDLMTHFVLARGAEINAASGITLDELRGELIGTAEYVESNAVLSALVSVDYLRRWAAALA